MSREKEKDALISKLIGFVIEFVESHETTEWVDESEEGIHESIEAYLIPKQEVEDLRAATKAFLDLTLEQKLRPLGPDRGPETPSEIEAMNKMTRNT
jgi:hypothetical protein